MLLCPAGQLFFSIVKDLTKSEIICKLSFEFKADAGSGRLFWSGSSEDRLATDLFMRPHLRLLPNLMSGLCWYWWMVLHRYSLWTAYLYLENVFAEPAFKVLIFKIKKQSLFYFKSTSRVVCQVKIRTYPCALDVIRHSSLVVGWAEWNILHIERLWLLIIVLSTSHSKQLCLSQWHMMQMAHPKERKDPEWQRENMQPNCFHT